MYVHVHSVDACRSSGGKEREIGWLIRGKRSRPDIQIIGNIGEG
jgi:hypothetical protein